MSDPQSYCPFCKRTHDAPEFIETLERIAELEARVDELEAALRGYVKATTGQESAIVTFPMALEGEVK